LKRHCLANRLQDIPFLSKWHFDSRLSFELRLVLSWSKDKQISRHVYLMQTQSNVKVRDTGSLYKFILINLQYLLFFKMVFSIFNFISLRKLILKNEQIFLKTFVKSHNFAAIADYYILAWSYEPQRLNGINHHSSTLNHCWFFYN
jgi:hypothetical protein